MLLQKLDQYKKPIALFFAVVMEMQLIAGIRQTLPPVQMPHRYAGKSPKHRQPAVLMQYLGDQMPTAPGSDMQLAVPSTFNNSERQPLSAPLVSAASPATQVGPGQPEMTSFTSVAGGNMVNLFTGDFNYSVPLLDVGGYPLTLGYNQGSSPEEEASWVGLGWNVNPGSITRNLRGIPDDFDGDVITKTQNMKEEKEWGVTPNVGIELFGQTVGINVGLGVLKNNKRGWGSMVDLGVNVSTGKAFADGALSFGLGANLGYNSQSGTSYGVNGSMSFAKQMGSNGIKGTLGLHAGLNYHSRAGLVSKTLSADFSFSQHSDFILLKNLKSYTSDNSLSVGSVGLSQSFSIPAAVPTMNVPVTSTNFTYNGRVGGEFWGIYGNFGISGYFKKKYIANPVTFKNAYGMLYLSDANDPNALKDFNRANDGVVTEQTPHIAMPMYTQDIFSITGEGTGGMFKVYRGELGFVNDPYTYSSSSSFGVGAEVGVIRGGLNFDIVKSPSSVGTWTQQNRLASALRYTKSDSSYEAAYLRNPGEKTTADETFMQAMGGDNLVAVKLEGTNEAPYVSGSILEYGDNQQIIKTRSLVNAGNTGIPVKELVVKKDRSKRTQLISYLNAEEASSVGLDKYIRSYALNDFTAITACNGAGVTNFNRVQPGLRKAHHLSQITITQNDGKRYIYGLPAYNKTQEEYTFTVKSSNTVAGSESMVHFDANDIAGNNLSNENAKDWFFEKQAVPSYAHSFLLSGLVSPDYVDVTNDGITSDDLGEAVKFNYSLVAGKHNGMVNWRTPNTNSGVANHNKGLLTDPNDDKANIVFGQKELWYLHSIESKNLVAVFKMSPRADVFEPLDVLGGLDTTKRYQKLDSILLFSKEDLRVAGSVQAAIPIKVVHFVYDYSLCTGFNPNLPAQGKLSLKEIYFTFRNSDVRRNITRFSYKNTSYVENSQDRWGNFKPKSNNPNSQLTNADFPYATQQKSLADQNAGMWCLDSITLPSRGAIKVQYEADDYAFVQNKKAAKMFNLLGFSNSPTGTIGRFLKTGLGTANEYVFVNLETPITTGNRREKFYNSYIYNGLPRATTNPQQIYLRLKLDIKGAEEMIPVFTDYDDYGVTADGTKGWIHLKSLTQAMPRAIYSQVVNFLKTNMPAKVYRYYDTYDAGNAGITVILSMLSFFANIAGNINEERNMEASCLARNIGVKANLDQSFIRLCAPAGFKYGGGSRVKQVKVYDNWDQMRGHFGSVYGQQYQYTTNGTINGQPAVISSGVASYEPMVGGDENVFKGVLVYSNSIPAGPAQIGTVEVPLGEAFYPAAGVGYSKVTVSSIHKGDTLLSGMGKQVSEFYTSRDFPVKITTTPLQWKFFKTPDNFSLGDLLGWGSKSLYTRMTASEGFRIELNDMEGKTKAESNYRENDSMPISTVTYKYKVNANGTLITEGDALYNSNGDVRKTIIGKDMEVLTDFRYQVGSTTARNYGANAGILVFTLFVVPWLIPAIKNNFTSEEFRSAAFTKVIYRYGMIDEVVKVDKGSMVSTKNTLYDSESGEPILNRTNNQFKDPIYTLSYPAHLAYPDMSGGYKNIGISWRKLIIRNGKVLNNKQVERFIQHGDELLFHDKQPRLPAASVEYGYTACTGTNNSCAITDYPEYGRRAWVVNANRNSATLAPVYFIIDENGSPMDGNDVVLKIVRSGRRNLVSSNIGTVVSMDNPVVNNKITNYSGTSVNILGTTAVEFKDDWNVGQQSRLIDTVAYTVYGPYKDTTVILYPDSIINITKQTSVQNGLTFSNTSFQFQSDKFYTTLLKRIVTGRCESNETTLTNSLLHFNMSGIPTNITIKKARLILNGDPMETLNNNTDFNNIGFIRRTLEPWTTNPLTLAAYTNVNATSNAGLGTSGPIIGVTDPATEITLMPDPSYLDEEQNINLNVKNMVVQMNNGRRNGSNRSPAFFLSNTAYGALGLPTTATPYFKGRYYNNCAVKDTPTCWSESSDTTIEPVPSISPDCKVCDKIELRITYNNLPDSSLFTGGNWVSFGIYSFYVKHETHRVCQDLFTGSKYINPFIHGASGNWRPFKSYVYYDLLKEQTTVANTNIRKEGTISNFGFLWQLGAAKMTKITNTTVLGKWKWNSLSQLYNKRGYEVQNTNPLNIYSNILYGYDETLPIANTQNAEYRYSTYDGFEDYNYIGSNCIPDMCMYNRQFELTGPSGINVRSYLVKDTAHTGIYSMKLPAGKSVSALLKLTGNTISYDTSFYSRFRIITDCVKRDTAIISSGNGMNIYSAAYVDWRDRRGCRRDWMDVANFVDPQLESSDYPLEYYSLNADHYSKLFSTNIVIPKTGYYRFMVDVDDFESAVVKNSTDYIAPPASQSYIDVWRKCASRTRIVRSGIFVKGQKLKINFPFGEIKGGDFALMVWDTPDPCTGTGSTGWQDIPREYMYTNINDINVQYSTCTVCHFLDSLKLVPTQKLSRFEYKAGTKMLFSAWAKSNRAVTNNSTYTSYQNMFSNLVTVKFTNSSNVVLRTDTLKPVGNIIEGWQKIEGEIAPAPAGTVNVEVRVDNGNNEAIYLDDLRIIPWNAQQVSYVYHPSNMRLMAELDANNYATFYEYDAEGGLIRKKKETIEGIKTLVETRSAQVEIH